MCHMCVNLRETGCHHRPERAADRRLRKLTGVVGCKKQANELTAVRACFAGGQSRQRMFASRFVRVVSHVCNASFD